MGPPPTTKPPTPPQVSRTSSKGLLEEKYHLQIIIDFFFSISFWWNFEQRYISFIQLILAQFNCFFYLIGSREYRTPPAVAPPQVPSHYAPNYPIGHPRRAGERGPGYSTLPMAPNQHQAMSPPQIGMVHPLNTQQHPQTPPPPPPPINTGYVQEHHMSMPRILFPFKLH